MLQHKTKTSRNTLLKKKHILNSNKKFIYKVWTDFHHNLGGKIHSLQESNTFGFITS